jgi:hypothetical protein
LLSLQSISVNIGYNVAFGQVNQMKSLKIPTGKSEAVNQRTDKAMTKIKRTKRQTMIYKTHHRKLKIE